MSEIHNGRADNDSVATDILENVYGREVPDATMPECLPLMGRFAEP